MLLFLSFCLLVIASVLVGYYAAQVFGYSLHFYWKARIWWALRKCSPIVRQRFKDNNNV